MKKSSFFFFAFIFISLLIGIYACSKAKSGSGIKTSAYNDTSSHNVGTACFNCHTTGGSNSYWWTVAGTVYKPDTTYLNPNSTVYLFTNGNGGGTLTALLPVDAKGNFYTSTVFDWGSGLYPGVKSSSGQVRYMQASTTNGNCNHCHNGKMRIVVN